MLIGINTERHLKTITGSQDCIQEYGKGVSFIQLKILMFFIKGKKQKNMQQPFESYLPDHL